MTDQQVDQARQDKPTLVATIWNAWNDAYEAQGPLEDMGQPIAAALRAAVEQVVPECATEYTHDYSAGANNERIVIRSRLLAIAAELEADR